MSAGNFMLYFSRGIVVTGIMFPLIVGAATSETVNISLTLISPQPTCNVTVTPSKDLGALYTGEKRHSVLPVTIACTGTIKSALTAQNLNGGLQTDNYRVSVPMGSSGAGNGPFLWLQDNNGNNVKLTGAAGDAFCIATDTGRTCNITPVTSVNSDSGWGSGSVTMRFDITYPA